MVAGADRGFLKGRAQLTQKTQKGAKNAKKTFDFFCGFCALLRYLRLEHANHSAATLRPVRRPSHEVVIDGRASAGQDTP
jgi:hypothetical protein